MNGSQGGYTPGHIMIPLRRGPRSEGVDDLTIYEDECFLNRDGVCVRRDPGHLALSHPPQARWWLCPNTPRCPHGAILHDVYDADDPTPACCVDGCPCGHETLDGRP